MPDAQTTVENCPKCGKALQSAPCPDCDDDDTYLPDRTSRRYDPHSLFMITGVLGVAAIIFGAYPMLDGMKFLLIGIGVSLVPYLVFHLRNTFTKSSLAADRPGTKKAWIYSGIVAWSFLLLIVCNGALDRSITPVQTVVVDKGFSEGRFGSKNYSLTVNSWRPGNATEELSVDAGTYDGASVDSKVTVDVHKGLFGWPWYSGVELRPY